MTDEVTTSRVRSIIHQGFLDARPELQEIFNPEARDPDACHHCTGSGFDTTDPEDGSRCHRCGGTGEEPRGGTEDADHTA